MLQTSQLKTLYYLGLWDNWVLNLIALKILGKVEFCVKSLKMKHNKILFKPRWIIKRS